jgi:hypothetical protein
MAVSIFGTLAGTFSLRFLEQHPFLISYASGKGLVSYPEIARTSPNYAEDPTA